MADLIIEGIAKAFGPRAVLDGVTLSVASGSLITLLGASGSGKTTLLRIICGFERADAGAIRLDGKVVCGPGLHLAPERRNIGYVAQEGALFPHLSVGANIVFGLPRRERRAQERVERLLDMVGLPVSYAERPPHELSGGEQQRVALARALAPQPRIVLLDEPFSSLDAALRVETRQAIADALSAAGATALLVTHDQSEALSMGEQVAVLREGRLVQVASPELLYRRPVDADLARFVGEAVLLPGTARGGLATCSLGRLQLAAGMPEGPVDVLVRPEQIRLLDAPVSNAVRARVRSVIYYGHDANVNLSIGEGDETAVTARIYGHIRPRVGEDVWLFVDGEVVSYARLDHASASEIREPPAGAAPDELTRAAHLECSG